jgi:hypothetical protein
MQMLGNLVEKDGDFPLFLFLDLSYVHFNPELSHIVGNYWLLKHMLVSYDLWSDPPWKMMGKFGLTKSRAAEAGKVIPFWWPAAFPLISPPSLNWSFPLAMFNLLMVVFWGLRLWVTSSRRRGSAA